MGNNHGPYMYEETVTIRIKLQKKSAFSPSNFSSSIQINFHRAKNFMIIIWGAIKSTIMSKFHHVIS